MLEVFLLSRVEKPLLQLLHINVFVLEHEGTIDEETVCVEQFNELIVILRQLFLAVDIAHLDLEGHQIDLPCATEARASLERPEDPYFLLVPIIICKQV